MNSPNIPLDISDDFFGAVLNCAIRYCLGRQSYMPGLVMDYIRPLLSGLSDKTLWCMERDIREHEQYGYGHPNIDEPAWRTFLSDVQQEITNRNRESKNHNE